MAKKIREEGEKRVKKQGDEIFTCPFLSPPYKSCGLQNNIERGEGGGQILMQYCKRFN